METRLGLKLLWRHRVACLLQGAALATAALLTLVAMALYRPLHSTDAVPGAPCSNQYGVLGVEGADGQWSDRITWRQFAALRATHAFEAFAIATVDLDVSTGTGAHDATFIGMDQDAQKALCIRGSHAGNLRDNPGGFLTTDPSLAQNAQVRVGVVTMPVIDTLTEFRGFDPNGPHIDGVVPLDRLPDAGFDLKGAELGVVRVLVPRNVSASLLDQARLGAASAFPHVARFAVGTNIAMGAGEAATLRNFGGALAAIATALALLALVNIITYQVGRQPEIGWRIKVLRDQGAPASRLRLLAYVEPMVIGMMALAFAMAAAEPVLRSVLYVSQSERLSDIVFVRLSDAVIVAAALALTSVAIGELRTRVAARTVSRRLRRLADSAFDYLAAIEGMAAFAALVFAGAATVTYVRAAPAKPAYDMDHVRVYAVRLGRQDKVPSDFQSRAQQVLDHVAAETNGIAAFAENVLPIQSQSFETIVLQVRGETVLAEINRVSPSYFDVLRLPVSGRFVASDASPDGRHEASGGVANKALMDVMGFTQAQGQSIAALTPRSDKQAHLFTIHGSFDEHTSGNDSGAGDYALMPTLYVPYDQPHWGLKSYNLFVRYDPRFSIATVDRTAIRSIEELTPRAEIKARDLGQVFADATKRERMLGTLFGILAVGALAMCVCGVLALGTMRFTLSRLDHAVRFTMGATRRDLALRHVRRFMVPLLMGALFACGIFAISSSTIASWFGMTIVDSWLAAAGGLSVLLAATVTALLATAVPLLKGELAEWLKTE